MIIANLFQLIYFVVGDFFIFLYYGKWDFIKHNYGYVKQNNGLVRKYHKFDYNRIRRYVEDKPEIETLLKPQGAGGGFKSKYDALFKSKPICRKYTNLQIYN